MTTDNPRASAAESVTSIGLLRIDHVGRRGGPIWIEAIAFYTGRCSGCGAYIQETNEEQGRTPKAMLSVGPTAPPAGCVQLAGPPQRPVGRSPGSWTGPGPGVQTGRLQPWPTSRPTSAELRAPPGVRPVVRPPAGAVPPTPRINFRSTPRTAGGVPGRNSSNPPPPALTVRYFHKGRAVFSQGGSGRGANP